MTHETASTAAGGPRRGRGLPRAPAADRVLHRHLGLHRLQGLRGGLQGVERASPRTASTCWAVVTTTPARSAPAPGGTSPSSSRARRSRRRGAGRAWSASACQRRAAAQASCRQRGDPRTRRVPLADVVRRVQALHARRLPGRLPDRGAVPHRVRHRRRAGRRLQRLRLLRLRLPLRGDRPAARTTGGPANARCATTGCAAASNRPAPRPARPNPSSSARWTNCGNARPQRLDQLHDAGVTEARLYGHDRTTASAAPARSSCCWTNPRCTACRRTQWCPPVTWRRRGNTRAWPPRPW